MTWEKASEPLYKAGGHPMGLDACEAHKVWLTGSGKPGDDTLYSASPACPPLRSVLGLAGGLRVGAVAAVYYTADDCKGRGIALLTSKPVV